jgi:hypothetical protein
MNEFYQKEQEEYNKATGKGELITEKTKKFKSPIPDSADTKPTYTTKVARPNIPNPAIYSSKVSKK